MKHDRLCADFMFYIFDILSENLLVLKEIKLLSLVSFTNFSILVNEARFVVC